MLLRTRVQLDATHLPLGRLPDGQPGCRGEGEGARVRFDPDHVSRARRRGRIQARATIHRQSQVRDRGPIHVGFRWQLGARLAPWEELLGPPRATMQDQLSPGGDGQRAALLLVRRTQRTPPCMRRLPRRAAELPKGQAADRASEDPKEQPHLPQEQGPGRIVRHHTATPLRVSPLRSPRAYLPRHRGLPTLHQGRRGTAEIWQVRRSELVVLTPRLRLRSRHRLARRGLALEHPSDGRLRG
mmetsp:Transcript_1186/g.2498  ORF Transcript_1186/g.2498 Transcript_1186/m.2498 type:complete len:242 (+) Transcript_1186:382-1107(+)